MKRSASEIINDLESRIDHLEKQAGLFDFFRSEKTIETETKELEKLVKSVRGVSRVAIDIKNRDRCKMKVTYKGETLLLEGRCKDDELGIYGKGKRAVYIPGSPGVGLLTTHGIRSRGGRPSSKGGKINTYVFGGQIRRGKVIAVSLYTMNGSRVKDTEELEAFLDLILQDALDDGPRKREEEIERKRVEKERIEKERVHNRKVQREREERKRQRREMFERNRQKKMQGRQASLSSNRLVKNISFIVKDKGRQNGPHGWSWKLTTNKGDDISLYYEDHMGTEVEIKDPPKSMLQYTGKPFRGIAYISIADLSYFF
jgi:hypothetical protein